MSLLAICKVLLIFSLICTLVAKPSTRTKRQTLAEAASAAEVEQPRVLLNYLRKLGAPLLKTASDAFMTKVLPKSVADELQRYAGSEMPKDPFPATSGDSFGSDVPTSLGRSSSSSSSFGSSGILDLSQLNGFSSGSLPGVAPIPVPTFPKEGSIQNLPGINSIPGLDSFNYIIGQLVPQAVQPVSHLLGGTINLENVDVQKMMGRWYQVITSPHVFKESCTITQFGALTNSSYSASFIVLKFFREGNTFGPPRMVVGYGFKVGKNGTFTIHSSNSPNSEPFMVVKLGPLNENNQYEYAVISNWIRYPVYVLARDPERFAKYYMRNVLQFMEEKRYINTITKALHLIAPVSYEECQYTPIFK
ncbi:unnamed protein product [Soboliphyme baturini]|uniref:Lipocln_cytosolic_FA-bd_dom domain-containing protein n=1 Tax=Soboliphyme baturini TaxID=241478 RepID=A0A183IHB6_9BILA|nr:unnamed protein product [Soboliphyme baturini]